MTNKQRLSEPHCFKCWARLKQHSEALSNWMLREGAKKKKIRSQFGKENQRTKKIQRFQDKPILSELQLLFPFTQCVRELKILNVQCKNS